MPTSDPMTILLAHDRWATERLLEACDGLSEDQFHQAFEMGPGSLHDTITHMLSALRGWGDLLAGRPVGGPIEPVNRPVNDLRALHTELADAFARHVRPVEEKVSGERGGRAYTFTRGGVVTHVCTHGMHHRAQCLNMLRHLGIAPLPPSSVVEWMLMADDQG